MRTSSLAAALALLVLGCGLENDGTGPQEPGPALPDPVGLPAPEFATASSGWSSRTPMPTGRYFHAAAAVNGVIYVVGGRLSNGTGTTSVQAYNPTNNTWATKAPLPAVRVYGNGAGVINGVLYLPGGADGKDVTKTLYAYNPTTNTWTTRAPMLAPGGCGASGVIAGKLYVYSGCTQRLHLPALRPRDQQLGIAAGDDLSAQLPRGRRDRREVLPGGRQRQHDPMRCSRPSTRRPTPGAEANPMPTARSPGPARRSAACCTSWAEGRPPSPRPRRWRPTIPCGRTWRGRDPLPGPRVGPAGGAVNGKLFTIGGGKGSVALTANEAYTPGDMWVTKSKMPVARESFAAAVVGGKLYAFGGRQNSTAIATGHVYDPGTNAWTSRAAMPQPRASSNGAGVINGIVYVPGGHNGDGIYTRSLYAYNPATNTWSTKANMPAAIGCGGSGVLGGKLYVYGTCGPDGSAAGRPLCLRPGHQHLGRAASAAPVVRFPAMTAVEREALSRGRPGSGRRAQQRAVRSSTRRRGSGPRCRR